MPELPLLLKAAVEQQKNPKPEVKTGKTSLQTKLGMSATVLGIIHSIAYQHPSLVDTPLALVGPWVAAFGIILVLLKR